MDSWEKNGRGWSEYSKLVLSELERLGDEIKAVNDSLNKINVEIATLKVKSGVWGLVGASIPVAIGLGIELLKSKP